MMGGRTAGGRIRATHGKRRRIGRVSHWAKIARAPSPCAVPASRQPVATSPAISTTARDLAALVGSAASPALRLVAKPPSLAVSQPPAVAVGVIGVRIV